MYGPVAQLVEQLTFNQWVAGSNPAGLTTNTSKGYSLYPLSALGYRKVGCPNLVLIHSEYNPKKTLKKDLF